MAARLGIGFCWFTYLIAGILAFVTIPTAIKYLNGTYLGPADPPLSMLLVAGFFVGVGHIIRYVLAGR